MSSWAVVAIVAIVIWGIVQLNRNRSIAAHKARKHEAAAHDPEAAREIEELRERIKVLERIATDHNSIDAQETKRISAEIERLRDKQG